MFNSKIDLTANNISKFKESSNPLRNENNLKGYVEYFRNKSHKFSNIDPLNLNSHNLSEDFNISNWGLSEIEKIDEFPLDDYLKDSNISNLTTISDLEKFLKGIYLNNVKL